MTRACEILMNKWLTDWAEFRSIENILNHVKHILKQILGPFAAFLLGFFLLFVGCVVPSFLGMRRAFVRFMRRFAFGLWRADRMGKMRRLPAPRRHRHLFKIVQRRAAAAAGKLVAGVPSGDKRGPRAGGHTGGRVGGEGGGGWRGEEGGRSGRRRKRRGEGRGGRGGGKGGEGKGGGGKEGGGGGREEGKEGVG